jgi:glycosyltransferase involved in cell wall biosynthesis
MLASPSPNLTVIVPVYNGCCFLSDTVESLLQQTYRDFHILIINDGSTDDSAIYLDQLTDPRIEVRHQKNQGLCATLNQAIASCTTEFIARLDQDDIAHPEKLQQQMDFLTANPDYDGVLSNITRITASGKELGHYASSSTQPIDDYQSSRYGCIVHSTLCCRRDSLLRVGGYRAALYPVDDYDLLLRMEEQCRLAVINQPLVKYRIHSQAGTFKTFASMDLKTRYAEAMAQRRRSGRLELSLTEFTEIAMQGHSLKQLQIRLNRQGRLMFLTGFGQLFGSLLLAPTHTFKRLLGLYLGKRREASIV